MDQHGAAADAAFNTAASVLPPSDNNGVNEVRVIEGQDLHLSRVYVIDRMQCVTGISLMSAFSYCRW